MPEEQEKWRSAFPPLRDDALCTPDMEDYIIWDSSLCAAEDI